MGEIASETGQVLTPSGFRALVKDPRDRNRLDDNLNRAVSERPLEGTSSTPYLQKGLFR